MGTQPSSAHLASLARCFLSSAAKAADPAVTLASGKMLETSGDVTVKSKAAGLPSIQFVARTLLLLLSYLAVVALDPIYGSVSEKMKSGYIYKKL